MRVSRLLQSVAVGAAMLAATPVLAETTVGQNDSGNCYPFSCFASQNGAGGVWYQEVYSASAFSAPIAISSIGFGRSLGGPMDSANYSLSFYLTSYGPTTLTADQATNEGALLANFGTFSVSGQMPELLTFSGTAFNYDPSLGNLLLNVQVLGLTEPHPYESFFNADYTQVDVGRAYGFADGSGSAAVNGALVTTFNPVAAVPEPATWALMIGGFGMVGGTMRRRKAKVTIAYA